MPNPLTMTRLKACTICGRPTPGSHCTKHTPPQHTTTQRGYGWQHQQRRAQLLESANGFICPICRQPILHGQPVDLHHTIPLKYNPSSIGDAIAHRKCNRGGGLSS